MKRYLTDEAIAELKEKKKLDLTSMNLYVRDGFHRDRQDLSLPFAMM